MQKRVRIKIQQQKYRDNYENYCATKIQSIWKMYVVRKQFIQHRNFIIIIQCHIKRLLAKKLLIKLRKEKYSINTLKNKNNLLQNNLNFLQENYMKQQSLMNQMRMKMKQQERENFQKEHNSQLLNEQNTEKIEDILFQNFELSNIINDYKHSKEESKQLLENATTQNHQDAETKLLLAMKINELLLKHNNAVEELQRIRRSNNNVSLYSFIRQFFS
jgi:myosin heavy subunit